MRLKRIHQIVLFVVALIGLAFMPMASSAKEAAQEYELINPEGAVKLEPMSVNLHPTTLEGKTVVLRSNGKHNADNALNRLAELLKKEVKNINLIKAWEVIPETAAVSQGLETSEQCAKKIAALKPAIVIASQAD